MKIRYLAAALLCGAATAAHSQVQFSGKGTPGHVTSVVTNSVIQDAGPAVAPLVTEFGIHKNGGLPFCITDVNNPPPFQAPYAQFCLAVTPSQAQLIVNSTGGSPPAFTFVINGTPFPIQTSANVPFVDGFLNTIGTGNFSTSTNVVFTGYSKLLDQGGGSFLNLGTGCTANNVTSFLDSAGDCFARAYNGPLFSPWGNVQNSPGTTNKIDSTAAWKSVIAAANINPALGGQSNSIIPQLNSGIWCQDATQSWITDQLIIPPGVGISGAVMAPQNCQINVNASSPAIQASGAIRIGDGTHIGAAQYVNDILLNMNQQAGIGLVCQACQDVSGFNEDFVYQVENGPGLWMDGVNGPSIQSVNTYKVTHNQVWGANARTPGGTGMLFTNELYPGDINGNDVLCYTTHCWTNAVQFLNQANSVSFNWTIEDNIPATPEAGIIGLQYTGDAVITLVGATVNSFGTAVQLRPTTPTPGAFNAFITGLFADNATTAIDNSSGLCGPAKTIPGSDLRISLFACGNIGYLDFNQVDFSGGTIINSRIASPIMTSTGAAPVQIQAASTSDDAILTMTPASTSTGGADRDHIDMFDATGAAGWQIFMLGDAGNLLQLAGSATGAPVNRVQFNASTGDETLQTGSLVISSIASDTGLTTATVCERTSDHRFFFGSGASGICAGTSSRRFKQEIAPMASSLDAIRELQPVTFRYKKGYGDNGARRQPGLIAEDAIKVLPDCVQLDANKQPNSVDYQCVAMHALKGEQELAAEVAHLRSAITRHHHHRR